MGVRGTGRLRRAAGDGSQGEARRPQRWVSGSLVQGVHSGRALRLQWPSACQGWRLPCMGVLAPRREHRGSACGGDWTHEQLR